MEIIRIAKRNIRLVQKSKSLINGNETILPIQPPVPLFLKMMSVIPKLENKKKMLPVNVVIIKSGRRDDRKETPVKRKAKGRRKKPAPKRKFRKLYIELPTTPALPNAASVKNKANTKEIIARIECLVSFLSPRSHFPFFFLFLFDILCI